MGGGDTGNNNVGFGLTGSNLVGIGNAYYNKATGQFTFTGLNSVT